MLEKCYDGVVFVVCGVIVVIVNYWLNVFGFFVYFVLIVELLFCVVGNYGLFD